MSLGVEHKKLASTALVAEWTSRPLADCAVWYSGGTPRKSNKSYWRGSIPRISAKSLNSLFIKDSADRVTESGSENGTRLVPEDSILFIVRGMCLKKEFRMGITTRPVTNATRRRAVMARDSYEIPPYANFFPDSFEDSELGSIPAGWRASTLGQETERCGGLIQTGPFGSQLHASDYVEAGVPVVIPKNIKARRGSTENIARITEHDANRPLRHRVQEGDLVYSRRGDVEKHTLIGPREIGWFCGTGCLLVLAGNHRSLLPCRSNALAIFIASVGSI